MKVIRFNGILTFPTIYERRSSFSISWFFFLILFLVFAFSCKKEDPPAKDPNAPEAPEITITSPTANTQYSQGQVISITGTIKDNKQVGVITVDLINISTNATTNLLTDHSHPTYPNTFTLSVSYTVPSSLTPGAYKISVNVNDFDGNVSVKTIDISIL